MSSIFITSDQHLGHANILKFKDENGALIRPGFADVDEMNEHIVDSWNSVVTDSDIVYCLGDVYFGQGHVHISRLKGRKRLILGNHDNGKDQVLQKQFQKITMWRMFPEFNCLLTHVPVHESSLYKVEFNAHGHIHQQKAPTDRHINCCVEAIGYKPIPIEELIPTK